MIERQPSVEDVQEERSRIYQQTQRIFQQILKQDNSTIQNPFLLLQGKFRQKDKRIAQLEKKLGELYKVNQYDKRHHTDQIKHPSPQQLIPQSSSSDAKSLTSSEEKRLMEIYKKDKQQLLDQHQLNQRKMTNFMTSILSYIYSFTNSNQNLVTVPKAQFQKLSHFYVKNNGLAELYQKGIQPFGVVQELSNQMDSHPQWIDNIQQTKIQDKFVKICEILHIRDLWDELIKQQQRNAEFMLSQLNRIKKLKVNKSLDNSTMNSSSAPNQNILIRKVRQILQLLDTQPSEVKIFEDIFKNRTKSNIFEGIVNNINYINQSHIINPQHQQIKSIMRNVYEKFYKNINDLLSKHNQKKLFDKLPVLSPQVLKLIDQSNYQEAQKKITYDINCDFDKIQRQMMFFSSDKLYYYYKQQK